MAKILLIDDDDALREMVATTLSGAGYEVIEAVDGKQGGELFRTNSPDLVITDLIMPRQEGIETIVALRRERPKVPIIAMSGGLNNSALYLQIAAKVGAIRTLQKPFALVQLLQVAAEALAEGSKTPAD